MSISDRGRSAKPLRLRSRRGHGYTLIELVVSMPAATLLMASLASTLFIASQAFEGNGPAVRKSAAGEVASDLMTDLSEAIRFSERTATAATFTVPDRDGDSNHETIRYAWSGTPGDPLTYEYNGSAPAILASDVQQFDLTYLLRTMRPPAI